MNFNWQQLIDLPSVRARVKSLHFERPSSLCLFNLWLDIFTVGVS